MALLDSIDKIVTRYFVLMTKVDFSYKGKIYQPKPLKISSLLLRDYTCPANCGACCARFSLDYLPGESRPYSLEKRIVNFNGKSILIYSDMQLDHSDYHCRNLQKEDARCGIYENRPFSCDFELIRPLLFDNPTSPNVLTQKLFGRKWAMKRVDGGRGTRCEMTPITDYSIDEVIRKMRRLQQWCIYFGIENKCDRVIQWVDDIREFVKFRQIAPVLLR